MQYILTEHELNRGCELIEAWQTEDMTLDCAYIEQTILMSKDILLLLIALM